MKTEKKVLLLSVAVAVSAIVMGATIPMVLESAAKKECEAFSQTTGYWVKFDPKNGCFVLVDNQYFVEKSLLSPTARPAFDPNIVGIDAAIKQVKEN